VHADSTTTYVVRGSAPVAEAEEGEWGERVAVYVISRVRRRSAARRYSK